jgi:hypothetical protein
MSSTSGKPPRTRSSYSLPSNRLPTSHRSHRSPCSRPRSLGSHRSLCLHNLCSPHSHRSLDSRPLLALVLDRAEMLRRFPYRRQRTSPS